MTNPRLTSEELEEYRRRAKLSPWLAYPVTAVKAIMPWHEATQHYRVLSGPNGAGKSTAGAADLVSYTMGYNPIRHEEYETPNVCWAVCVEYNSAGRVMFRKIADMLPRDESGHPKWKYYKQEHMFEIDNGSQIHVKSQKEGESSLLAERCRAIWIDEAMGGDTGEENFGELQARGLPDQPLDMLFTLTPKMDIGLDWMRRKLWCEPGKEPHPDFIPGTYCHRFELRDCLVDKGGFLTEAYVAMREATVDPDEREARLLGLWTPFTNRPAFRYSLLVKAAERAPKSKPVKIVQESLYSRPKLEEVQSGPCRLQRERESAHNYLGAWDPSSGLGKGHDPSAFLVFDRADLTVVFHAVSDNLGPDVFAREIVIPACRYYNEALLAVEVTGQGGGAALSAVRDSYYNLYRQVSLQKQGNRYMDRLGWNTTEQSRYRMIDALKRALTDDKWTPCLDLIDEMSHMMAKKTDSGKVRVEHQDGFHDDLAMAAGIALAIHYEEPVYDWPDLSKLAVRWGDTRTRIDLPMVG